MIVEDIVETGTTLNSIIKFLEYRKVASIEIVTLLDKPVEERKLNVDVKYIGTEIPDGFVVGYGLDFDQKYRNLPYIGLLKPNFTAKSYHWKLKVFFVTIFCNVLEMEDYGCLRILAVIY